MPGRFANRPLRRKKRKNKLPKGEKCLFQKKRLRLIRGLSVADHTRHISDPFFIEGGMFRVGV
jgi:hypothetical protein